jgi:hypothetical protein
MQLVAFLCRLQHNVLQAENTPDERAAKTRDLKAMLADNPNHATHDMRSRLVAMTGLQVLLLFGFAAIYLSWSDEFRNVLANLEEAGARGYSAQMSLLGARSMHVAAIQGDVEGFNASRYFLTLRLAELETVQERLDILYPSRFQAVRNFDDRPQVAAAVRFADPAGTVTQRLVRLSGTDVLDNFVSHAYRVAALSLDDLAAYRQGALPVHSPDLYFVLQNGLVVLRSLDQANALYSRGLGDQIARMIAMIVGTSAGLIFLEIAVVVVIFHRTARQIFSEQDVQLEMLQRIDRKAAKYHYERQLPSLTAEQDLLDKALLAESITGLVADSDDSSGDERSFDPASPAASSPTKSGRGFNGRRERHDAPSSGKSKEQRQATEGRSKTISIFYWSCLLFVAAAVAVVAFICTGVFTMATRSALELAGATRRRTVGASFLRLANELVWASVPAVSLQNSGIRELNSTDTVRCMLSFSATAMLSVHYALLYGEKAGWEALPASQGFLPVQPSDTDECSSFTWDREAFQEMKLTSGSSGRDKLQDDLMFQSGCLTALPSTVDHSRCASHTLHATRYNLHNRLARWTAAE